MAKFKKKLSKSGNLLNFHIKKNKPSFLTLNARKIFHYLWLTFIQALILWYFDPKYDIWIKIDILSFAISDILSQLASKIRLNKITTKTDLD